MIHWTAGHDMNSGHHEPKKMRKFLDSLDKERDRIFEKQYDLVYIERMINPPSITTVVPKFEMFAYTEKKKMSLEIEIEAVENGYIITKTETNEMFVAATAQDLANLTQELAEEFEENRAEEEKRQEEAEQKQQEIKALEQRRRELL